MDRGICVSQYLYEGTIECCDGQIWPCRDRYELKEREDLDSDPGLIVAVHFRGRGLISLQHSILIGQRSRIFCAQQGDGSKTRKCVKDSDEGSVM